GAIGNIKRMRAHARDRFFILGHSFGARIVYSATAQLLLYEAEQAYPPPGERLYREIRGPSDVIILLNPALEAAVYTPVNSLRRNRKEGDYKEAFSPKQEPLLVSIATTDDWAMRYAFPMGQRIGAARDDKELTALGYFDDYITHALGENSNAGDSTGSVADWTERFCIAHVCLTRLDQSRFNPFLVVKTSDILRGHNGIWKREFVDWLVGFLEVFDHRISTRTLEGRGELVSSP